VHAVEPQVSRTQITCASVSSTALGFLYINAGKQALHGPRWGVCSAPPPELRARLHGRARPRLDAVEGAYAPVPVWTRDRYLEAVELAYTRFFDTEVRHQLDAGVSAKAVLAVAEALASFANADTGRQCRPAIATLHRLTGIGVRTIKRARRALELLGLAVIVVAGRRRSLPERLVSHELGDKARGWATEYALSIPRRIASLLPPKKHSSDEYGTPPRRGLRSSTFQVEVNHPARERARESTPQPAKPRPTVAQRRAGRALAAEWSRHPACPAFIRDNPKRAARPLATAVARGWQVDDLNAAVAAQERTSGRRVDPKNPAGWLAWLINQHPTPPAQARRAELEHRAAARDARRAARRAEYDTARANAADTDTARRWIARIKSQLSGTTPTARTPMQHHRSTPPTRATGRWKRRLGDTTTDHTAQE
jgi:hypothetical protein